jgi:hypothetical protein
MTTAQRSLRLQSYRSSELTSLTFNKGEVFYDADLKTLRVYDGYTGSGLILASKNDFAPYSTTTQMNSAITTALTGYVTSTSLATTLTGYVTSTGLATSLTPYVTSTGLATTLGSYSTTTQMNTAISSALTTYATTSSVTTALTPYSTTTQMNTAIGAETTRATNAEALLAPKANPTFTGTVTAPTAVIGGVNIKPFSIAMAAAMS